jgi:hypothetical protein
MGNNRLAGASDTLSVAVLAPHAEFAAVRTDLRVDRWDAEQTDWALAKIQRDGFHVPADGSVHPDHFAHYGVEPYLTTVDENCNLVTEQGWAALLGGIAGTTMSLKFGAAAARIGVGTSVTAATGADTKLNGDTGGASTTSYYKLVSTAPVINTSAAVATLVFTSAFGGGVANFAWAEFGTDNGAADGVTITATTPVFLNHGISAQGTKASGQTWTATETISFGFPSGSGTLS